MGAFQISTTVLKFSALAFVSVVGLFYIDSGNYAPWNVSESAIDAIGRQHGHRLVQLLASRRRPSRRRRSATPIATCPARLFGTLASAVVYMLSLIAVFGILPTSELAEAGARIRPSSTRCSAGRLGAT